MHSQRSSHFHEMSITDSLQTSRLQFWVKLVCCMTEQTCDRPEKGLQQICKLRTGGCIKTTILMWRWAWKCLKMRAFYEEKGIYILKGAVSIPGVNMHYPLKGLIEQGAQLYSPGKEAYMLKGAVVGRQSILFTRRHQAGVMRIRDHQYKMRNFVSKHLVTQRQHALSVNHTTILNTPLHAWIPKKPSGENIV